MSSTALMSCALPLARAAAQCVRRGARSGSAAPAARAGDARPPLHMVPAEAAHLAARRHLPLVEMPAFLEAVPNECARGARCLPAHRRTGLREGLRACNARLGCQSARRTAVEQASEAGR